jgi:Right handed beta helix region/Protein of unknown function (DUF1565)
MWAPTSTLGGALRRPQAAVLLVTHHGAGVARWLPLKGDTPVRIRPFSRIESTLAILTAAAVGIGLAGVPAAYAAGTTRYVAPTGSDSNNGSSSSTPFRTIQKCASVAVAGDTCQVAGGTYRETVTPARSGTSSAPITFAAAPGSRPVIDGTDAVTGWTLDSGSIYKTSVTLSGTSAAPYSSTKYPSDSELWANQVFTGSSMVPEAAYPAPSTDPFNQTYVNGGWSSTRSAGGDCTTPPCNTTLTGTLTYNSFPAFGDMTGAVVYFAGGWVALSASVAGGNLSSSNHQLSLRFPQSDDNVEPGGGNVSKFRLVGKKAFLTGANQWFYDAGTHVLYLRAANNGVPSNVYAKKRNYGFDLRGKSYINVSTIGLFATTITTDDTSSNNVLDAVNGKFLSHWQTAQYDSSLPYAGIYDANHRFDSGVLLHGTNNILRNTTLQSSSGNGVNIKGSGHTVTNNLIHDVGYGGTYTAAVTIEVGASNIAISKNTLYNTGRDAINMNTNAYPNAGYTRIRISSNNIHGYAKIAYDLGGIYVCCDTAMTGSRIDHNVIHDPAQVGNGIHFDNGTYDVNVDHNVIYGLKGTGDINHGGNGINFGGHTNARPAGSNLPYLKGAFYNNTIVAGLNDTIFNYFASSSYVSNTVVRNNILDGNHPSGQTYGYISGGVPLQSNNLVTLHSDNGTGIDPLFTGGSDYTLRSTSSAINAGTVIAGITDGYSGSNPDIGAYEYGTAKWTVGCAWTGCF